MTTIETLKLCLEAIEGGWSFDRLDNEVGPAIRQALANEALDRMAENARELGLDYTLTQTGVGIGERAMQAYEAAKQRGWSGVSDERLMKMPDEPVAKVVPCYTPSGKRVALNTEHQNLPIGTDLYTRPQPAAQWVGLDWLPEHKCGLHLSHNEHRDVYETVEQFYESDYFVSPEEWQKAVAEDSVWVLHWYPETPIGFHRMAASTLDAIEQALKEKNT